LTARCSLADYAYGAVVLMNICLTWRSRRCRWPEAADRNWL